MAHSPYCFGTASSADVAHECLLTELFDAYILDQYLPNGRGTELCAEIRQRNRLAPIVFVTGPLGQSISRLRCSLALRRSW